MVSYLTRLAVAQFLSSSFPYQKLRQQTKQVRYWERRARLVGNRVNIHVQEHLEIILALVPAYFFHESIYRVMLSIRRNFVKIISYRLNVIFNHFTFSRHSFDVAVNTWNNFRYSLRKKSGSTEVGTISICFY